MRLPTYRTALALACLLGACQPQSPTLPTAAFGRWTTDAPRYQDRFFELDAHHLTFGTGEGKSRRDPILQIEVSQEDGRPLYRVEHLGDQGQSYVFSFYYAPTDGGVITLKNQAEIHWKKERGPTP